MSDLNYQNNGYYDFDKLENVTDIFSFSDLEGATPFKSEKEWFPNPHMKKMEQFKKSNIVTQENFDTLKENNQAFLIY